MGATLFSSHGTVLFMMFPRASVEGETDRCSQYTPFREVADDPAHVRLRYRVSGVREECRKLLLAETGVAGTLVDNERFDPRRYGALSMPYRCGTLRVERFEVSV
jgi:hypothetical protein